MGSYGWYVHHPKLGWFMNYCHNYQQETSKNLDVSPMFRSIFIWLVVYLPLWKIWKSVGMMTFPIYGKIKVMFQSPPTIYGGFSMAMLVNQRIKPIKSHETTIFLWFSHGFPMVFPHFPTFFQLPWRSDRSAPAASALAPVLRWAPAQRPGAAACRRAWPDAVVKPGGLGSCLKGGNHGFCSRR